MVFSVIAFAGEHVLAGSPDTDVSSSPHGEADYSSNVGKLRYDIACPGRSFLERRGPSRYPVGDEGMASSIHDMTRTHAVVCIYVSVADLDVGRFYGVNKSIERLNALVSANADQACRVEIVLVAVLAVKPPPTTGKKAGPTGEAKVPGETKASGTVSKQKP
jgi:hypothetical protein